MKIKRIMSVILSIFLYFSACMVVLAEEDEVDLAIMNGCHSIDGGMSFLGQDQLIENAKSVFLFETNSETLMYAYNADVQMYPASLVKIMTALIVLEQAALSDTVTVTASALDAVSSDAVSADLQEGERLTVEQLLYCMLVRSANDAAAVLAEHIAGSQTAFVELMNSRAQELGCTGTTFTNAHGLHNDLQLTTARDVCRVLMQALKHETFRDAFGAEYYTVEKTNLHEERNYTTNNYLMNTDVVSIHYDERVTGGRSGETADGYRCIATTSQQGNMELICIVLGSRSTYLDDGYSIDKYGGCPETSKLLDLGYSGYSRQQIIYKNQILRQQPVLNGDCDVFIASNEDFSTVLPEGFNFDQLTFRFTDVPGSTQAPVSKGQNMAALQVWYGPMCVAQTDLYAMNDVPVAFSKTVPLDTQQQSGSWVKAVLTVLVIVVVAGLMAVLVLRVRNTVFNKNRKKNKRRH